MLGLSLLRSAGSAITTAGGTAWKALFGAGSATRFVKEVALHPRSIGTAWKNLSTPGRIALGVGGGLAARSMLSGPDNAMLNYGAQTMDPRLLSAMYGPGMASMFAPGAVNPAMMLANPAFAAPYWGGYHPSAAMGLDPISMIQLGGFDPMTRLALAQRMGGYGQDPRLWAAYAGGGFAAFNPASYASSRTANAEAQQLSRSGHDWAMIGDVGRAGQSIALWRAGKALARGGETAAVTGARTLAEGRAAAFLGPRIAEKSFGKRLIAGAGEKAARSAVGKGIARFVPFLNWGIAAADTAEAVRLTRDPNAGLLKKGLGWLTAGLSTVAALPIPGVSQLASGAALVTSIARDFAPGSTVNAGTAAEVGARVLAR
jgi:hypothetical protein